MKMSANETARIQYVFLDVVGFTHNRSVEAQSTIVEAINSVVASSLDEVGVSEELRILIPTGDGLAIALFDAPEVDTHLKLSLAIIRRISEHNEASSDPMRHFKVRVGINENIDNVVRDINGQRNVAGAGISLAQRIMDQADGGQILVGQSVYDALRQRERYMSTWRAFSGRAKHNTTFRVYQYVSKDSPGLNVETPNAFSTPVKKPSKLTKFAAYYFSHAIVNADFLRSRKSDPVRDYVAILLLALRAKDSIAAEETPTHEEPIIMTWRSGISAFEGQYVHYREMEFWPLVMLSECIIEKYLKRYSDYFEGDEFNRSYWLVSKGGIAKLLEEWPAIATKFSICGK